MFLKVHVAECEALSCEEVTFSKARGTNLDNAPNHFQYFLYQKGKVLKTPKIEVRNSNEAGKPLNEKNYFSSWGESGQLAGRT